MPVVKDLDTTESRREQSEKLAVQFLSGELVPNNQNHQTSNTDTNETSTIPVGGRKNEHEREAAVDQDGERESEQEKKHQQPPTRSVSNLTNIVTFNNNNNNNNNMTNTQKEEAATAGVQERFLAEARRQMEMSKLSHGLGPAASAMIKSPLTSPTAANAGGRGGGGVFTSPFALKTNPASARIAGATLLGTGTARVGSYAPIGTTDASLLPISLAVEHEKARKLASEALARAVELAEAKRRSATYSPNNAASANNIGSNLSRAEIAHKRDMDFYERYEKLHQHHEEIEQVKRDIAASRFGSSGETIRRLLAADDDSSSSAADKAGLGDRETFESVQKLLANLIIHRAKSGQQPNSSGENADTPEGQIEKLKRKVIEQRDAIDDYRKKNRELTAALRIAAMESKSSQELLADRHDEIHRLRQTVNTLQLQVKNLKSRDELRQTLRQSGGGGGSSGGAGATSAASSLMRDLDQLRTDYQQVAEANLILEKEVRMLRQRLSNPGAVTATSALRSSHNGRTESWHPASGRSGGTTNATITNNGNNTNFVSFQSAVLSSSKKLAIRERFESQERQLMSLFDADANKLDILSKRMSVVMNVSSGASLYSSGLAEGVQIKGIFDGTQRAGIFVRNSFTHLNNNNNNAVSIQSSASPALGNSPTTESAASPKQQTLVRDTTGAFEPPSSSPARADDKSKRFNSSKSSRAWNALRQRLVRIVAISRADILRREEVHLTRMRGKIATLTQDLASVSAERDLLVEKVELLLNGSTATPFDLASMSGDGNLGSGIFARSTSIRGRSNRGGGGGRRESGSYGTSPLSGGKDKGEASSSNLFDFDPKAELDMERLKKELNELKYIMKLRGQHSQDGGGDVPALPDTDRSLDAMFDVLHGKVTHLQEQVAQRDATISELHKHLAAVSGSSSSSAASPTYQYSASGSGGGGASVAESISALQDSITIKSLQKELLKKDAEIVALDKDIREREARVGAIQSQLSEARAQLELGLSKKAAARVAGGVRRWVDKAAKNAATFQRHAALMERAGLKFESELDEEQELLLQLFNLADNHPGQKAVIEKLLKKSVLRKQRQAEAARVLAASGLKPGTDEANELLGDRGLLMNEIDERDDGEMNEQDDAEAQQLLDELVGKVSGANNDTLSTSSTTDDLDQATATKPPSLNPVPRDGLVGIGADDIFTNSADNVNNNSNSNSNNNNNDNIENPSVKVGWSLQVGHQSSEALAKSNRRPTNCGNTMSSSNNNSNNSNQNLSYHGRNALRRLTGREGESNADRRWFVMRRTFLRLITVREEAWRTASSERARDVAAKRVKELYSSLMKLEQAERSHNRPAFCVDAALESVQFATAPLLVTDRSRLEDVDREYDALKHLVDARATHERQLQSQRDEALAELSRLSRDTNETERAAVAAAIREAGALSVVHRVSAAASEDDDEEGEGKRGETAAYIGSLYGISDFTTLKKFIFNAASPTPASAFSVSSLQHVWLPVANFGVLQTLSHLATLSQSQPQSQQGMTTGGSGGEDFISSPSVVLQRDFDEINSSNAGQGGDNFGDDIGSNSSSSGGGIVNLSRRQRKHQPALFYNAAPLLVLRHHVQPNETIQSIAMSLGVSENAVLEACTLRPLKSNYSKAMISSSGGNNNNSVASLSTRIKTPSNRDEVPIVDILINRKAAFQILQQQWRNRNRIDQLSSGRFLVSSSPAAATTANAASSSSAAVDEANQHRQYHQPQQDRIFARIHLSPSNRNVTTSQLFARQYNIDQDWIAILNQPLPRLIPSAVARARRSNKSTYGNAAGSSTSLSPSASPLLAALAPSATTTSDSTTLVDNIIRLPFRFSHTFISLLPELTKKGKLEVSHVPGARKATTVKQVAELYGASEQEVADRVRDLEGKILPSADANINNSGNSNINKSNSILKKQQQQQGAASHSASSRQHQQQQQPVSGLSLVKSPSDEVTSPLLSNNASFSAAESSGIGVASSSFRAKTTNNDTNNKSKSKNLGSKDLSSVVANCSAPLFIPIRNVSAVLDLVGSEPETRRLVEDVVRMSNEQQQSQQQQLSSVPLRLIDRAVVGTAVAAATANATTVSIQDLKLDSLFNDQMHQQDDDTKTKSPTSGISSLSSPARTILSVALADIIKLNINNNNNNNNLDKSAAAAVTSATTASAVTTTLLEAATKLNKLREDIHVPNVGLIVEKLTSAPSSSSGIDSTSTTATSSKLQLQVAITLDSDVALDVALRRATPDDSAASATPAATTSVHAIVTLDGTKTLKELMRSWLITTEDLKKVNPELGASLERFLLVPSSEQGSAEACCPSGRIRVPVKSEKDLQRLRVQTGEFYAVETISATKEEISNPHLFDVVAALYGVDPCDHVRVFDAVLSLSSTPVLQVLNTNSNTNDNSNNNTGRVNNSATAASATIKTLGQSSSSSSSSASLTTGEVVFCIALPPILARLLTVSSLLEDNYRIRKAVERDAAQALADCPALRIYREREIKQLPDGVDVDAVEHKNNNNNDKTNNTNNNNKTAKQVVAHTRTTIESGIKRIVARELRDRNDWIEVVVVTTTKKIAFDVKKYIVEHWMSGYRGADATMPETIKLLHAEAAAVTEVKPDEIDMLRFGNLRELKVRTVDLAPSLKIVRKGDMLKSVAIAHGVGIDALIAANPEAVQTLLAQDFEADRRPLAGEKILIPKPTVVITSYSATGDHQQILQLGVLHAEKVIETLAGDTLIDVASRQNCSLRQLKKLNLAVLPLFGVVQLLRIPSSTTKLGASLLTMMMKRSSSSSSTDNRGNQSSSNRDPFAAATTVRSMAEGDTVVAVALRFGADIDEVYINADDLYLPKKSSLRVPPSVGGMIVVQDDDDRGGGGIDYEEEEQHEQEVPFSTKCTDIILDDDYDEDAAAHGSSSSSSSLAAIAARWGISVRELTLYNASVVRVRRGAFVTIVSSHLVNGNIRESELQQQQLPRAEIDLVAFTEKKMAASPSPSTTAFSSSSQQQQSTASTRQQRKYMKQNPVGIQGEELIIDCPVRPTDTVQSLALQYQQSFTSILDLNPEIAEHAGAAAVLVPVAEEHINDVLVSQPPHLFAVVPHHRSEETLQTMCKKFAVPFARANDVNLMLPDETRESNWLMPVASATAAALCRQMGHPLYFLQQPNRGETLARMAERCLGSASHSDQFVPIGKPLGGLGIHHVLVPISTAMGREMLANGEALLVTLDESSSHQQPQVVNALPEVPSALRFTQTAFIEARERSLANRKTELEAKATELDRLLGQVSSRIDATEREYTAVSKLRGDLIKKMQEQQEKELSGSERNAIHRGAGDHGGSSPNAEQFSATLGRGAKSAIGGSFIGNNVACQTDPISIVVDPTSPSKNSASLFTFTNKHSGDNNINGRRVLHTATQTIAIAAYQNTSAADEQAANVRKMVQLEKEVASLQEQLSGAIDELMGYKNNPHFQGGSNGTAARKSNINNSPFGAREAMQVELQGKDEQIKALQDEVQQLHAALTDAFESSSAIFGGGSSTKHGANKVSSPIARTRALIVTKSKCAQVKQSCRDLKALVIRLFGGAIDQLQDAAAEAGTGELDGLSAFFVAGDDSKKSSAGARQQSSLFRFKVRDSDQAAVDAILQGQHDIAAPLGRTRSMPCMRSIITGSGGDNNRTNNSNSNILDIPASRIARPEDWMTRQVHDYVVGQVSQELSKSSGRSSNLPGQIVAPGRTWVPGAKPTMDKNEMIHGASFRLQENQSAASSSKGRSKSKSKSQERESDNNEYDDEEENDLAASLRMLQEEAASAAAKAENKNRNSNNDKQTALNVEGLVDTNVVEEGKTSTSKSGQTPQRRLYEKFMSEAAVASSSSAKAKTQIGHNVSSSDSVHQQTPSTSRKEQLKRFIPMLQLIQALQTNVSSSSAAAASSSPTVVPNANQDALPHLTIEGRQQIERAREQDEQLRRETMSIAWKQMATRIQIKKAKIRMEDLSLPVTDRRSMNLLVSLWKHWMAKWNSRRRTILVQRRSNIEDLVSQFVASNKENTKKLFVVGSNYDDASNRFTRADFPPHQPTFSSSLARQRVAASMMIHFPQNRAYPAVASSSSSSADPNLQFSTIYQTSPTTSNTATNKKSSPVPPPQQGSVRHGHTLLRGLEMPLGFAAAQQQSASSPGNQQRTTNNNPRSPVPPPNVEGRDASFNSFNPQRSSRHFDRVVLPPRDDSSVNNNKTQFGAEQQQ